MSRLGRSPRVRLALFSCWIAPLLSTACSERESGPLYEQASAQLVQIRPRHTVEPSGELARDPNSITSWWPVQGTAVFRTTSEGVDVTVALRDCRTGYSYPVRIYTQSCSELRAGTKPWDAPRGKLATNALCIGAPGARLYDSRARSDAKAWTIGGSESSDLIGRSIAAHDPDTGEPLVCGTIELPDGGAPFEPFDAAALPERVAAEAANFCLLRLASGQVDASVRCPDPIDYGRCARTHCVDHCRGVCADHFACLAPQPECSGACVPDATCHRCLDGQCGFGFCRKQLSCAQPTPNGPCTELRACCMRQGPLAGACLESVSLVEDTSGDRSCLGTLNDWDFNTNFAYRSPCYQEGFAPQSE
jgi:hypothetical protein